VTRLPEDWLKSAATGVQGGAATIKWGLPGADTGCMTSFARITVATALIALAAAPAAGAQTTPPSGGVSALQIGQSGVSLEVDPQKGASLGADTPATGGINVGAGPQGLQLQVGQGGQGGGANPSTTTTPSQPADTTPGGGSPPSTRRPASGDSPTAAAPAGPGGEAGGTGTPGSTTSAGASGTSEAGTAESRGGGDRRAGAEPAADRGPRGVAPVIDLIEKVPAALWAALASLGLIALALWLMWVRGRRRLARNAWVDTASPEMNTVAFESLLAQEWARSERYQRPLGLLLLELEEPASSGTWRPLTGRSGNDAQDAITSHARESDTVAQLSPSRFAVICPESSPGSVETLARRLEHSLEAARLHARVGTAARIESDRGPADLVSRAAVGIDEQPTWANPVVAPAAPDAQPVAV
jgi:GGDEF domain-containing protein